MYSIRKAIKEDKGIIASLMVDASGGICEYLLSDFPPSIKAHTILSFEVGKNIHPLSFNNCIIAEYGHQSVGVLCCYPASQFANQLETMRNFEKRVALKPFYDVNFPEKSLYIDTLSVCSEYQSMGIGKLLFRNIKFFLNEGSYENLSLYVWESNEKAIKFYEKFGFEIIKKVSTGSPDFPIKENRLLMAVSLSRFNQLLNVRE